VGVLPGDFCENGEQEEYVLLLSSLGVDLLVDPVVKLYQSVVQTFVGSQTRISPVDDGLTNLRNSCFKGLFTPY
jgi:hypothetical protein